MHGYPLFLNLQGKNCLVYGGGEVATRKIEAFLKRGAKVLCISKAFSQDLKKMAEKFKPDLKLKKTHSSTVVVGLKTASPTLVIAATSECAFNASVAQFWRKKRVWVNAVDDPENRDFYAAAIVEKGPLQIAISTGGTSPLFAKKLRETLEKVIPSSVGETLKKIGKVRAERVRMARKQGSPK